VPKMHHKKIDTKKPYTIQSVIHALDLLEQFRGDTAEFSLSDLSRLLHLQKNKVFRLLATLEKRNFIEHNICTESYRLGLKNIEMGQIVVRQRRHLHNIRPVMESLAKECKETLCLSVLQDYHAINVHVVNGINPLRVVQRTGGRVPAYCTSAGKAQIAYFTEDKLNRYLESCQFQSYTPATIIDTKLLLKHLQQINRQGYALDLEELEVGVKSVSAPVRDHTSNAISAITCYFPATQPNDARIEDELIPFIIKGATEISEMLGYSRN